MELSKVRNQRSELVQLLLLLIIIFLGIVTYRSFQSGEGYVIPSLMILSLGACLYVIIKERSLKKIEAVLVTDLIEKERQVKQLDQELKDEQVHLEEEKTKATAIGLRLRELTALYKAISTVNSVNEPDRANETVLRAALELVGGNTGSLMLVDEQQKNLMIDSTLGLAEQIVKNTRQPIGEGIAGWVAEQCEPVLLTEDSKKDERFLGLVLRDKEIRSALVIPLYTRGNIIGVLNLNMMREASTEPFTEYDLRMVTIFAQHASISIENSQLLSTLHRMKSSSQTA